MLQFNTTVIELLLLVILFYGCSDNQYPCDADKADGGLGSAFGIIAFLPHPDQSGVACQETDDKDN